MLNQDFSSATSPNSNNLRRFATFCGVPETFVMLILLLVFSLHTKFGLNSTVSSMSANEFTVKLQRPLDLP